MLGGYRASGRLRVGDRLTRVSLIGGVDLRIPADARVEVHGLSIGGRDLPADPEGTGGPEIVIRAYGILGGVKVRRAAAR